MARRWSTWVLLALAFSVVQVKGDQAGGAPKEEVATALSRLRALEARARAHAGEPQPWLDVAGSEPRRILRVEEGSYLALLGRGALRRVDGEGATLDEVAAPPGARGLAIAGDVAFVVAPGTRSVHRYRMADLGALEPWPAPIAGARDVVGDGDGRALVVDAIDDRLVVVDGAGARELATCAGPRGITRAGPWVAVRCGIDPVVQLWRLDGEPTLHSEVQRAAPATGLALREEGSAVQLAWAGPESHDLDRSEGFFGHIDAAVAVFTVHVDGRITGGRERLLGGEGIVDPTALMWVDDRRLFVTGAGGERAITLEVATGAVRAHWSTPPGTADLARHEGGVITANPLLDALVVIGDAPRTVHLDALPREAEARELRLGEILAFTSLMAPFNPSDGAHSRFSCATCHHDGGGVDGRIHRTGRFAPDGREIRATTKPLRGLFNNRPHFSRALDPDLTRVSHAEFRVAGKGSDHDPWFSLDPGERPWLAAITGDEELDPETLRRSLLRFLMRHTHPPNPLVQGRDHFTELERDGARIFAARCIRCHAPRRVTDEPKSGVPFAAWEDLVFSPEGPLVWASTPRHRTGVTPYVHPEGARTPSLRRLVTKRPYFTNGSAESLTDVAARVAWRGDDFWHDEAPATAGRLTTTEQGALVAFLRLL